jgi:glycosyltransferase involved in cell wall biosynthesis
MKIGIVTYRYIPAVGGAEEYLHDLCGLLKDAGHSLDIYQADSGEHAPGIRSLRPFPSPVPKLLGFNLILPTVLPSLAKEDLLIISYPEHFPPLFWHPRSIVLSHGATWTHEGRGVRKALRMLSARWAYRYATAYVCNDTFTFRELGVEVNPGEKAFSEVEPGRWYLPNCVDTERFRKRDETAEMLGGKSILVPRNFTYSRGIDLAIEAFARLSAREKDLQLVIAGQAIRDMEASIRYERELHTRVRRLSLGEKVTFRGKYLRDEMPSLYSSSHLTLIPSRMSEGTSLAALESMACGTPVVTTDVEGLRDLPGLKCPPTVDGILGALTDALARRNELAEEQLRQVRSRQETMGRRVARHHRTGIPATGE